MPGAVNVKIKWSRPGAGAGPTLLTPVSIVAWNGNINQAGSILTASYAVWQNEAVPGNYPIQRSFRWKRDGVFTSNYGATYTTQSIDIGKSISVVETAYFLSESNPGNVIEAPAATSSSESSAVAISGSVASDLVYNENLSYIGSFFMKTGEYQNALSGGAIVSFMPENTGGVTQKTILVNGANDDVNTYPYKYAQIAIPSTLADGFVTSALPYSSTVKPASIAYNDFYDIYSGQLTTSGMANATPSQAIPSSSGKMLMGSFQVYPPDQPYSYFWQRSADISSSQIDAVFMIKDPAVTNPAYSPRWGVGYLLKIPSAHQAALGNKQYLGGVFALSIISSQSDGPSLLAFGDSDVGSAVSKYSSGTATGGGLNTIILSASDTNPDGFYVGSYIFVSGSSTYPKIITAYQSSTKTATVNSNWSSVPTSASQYSIYPVVDGKQLLGYYENELQSLGTGGAASAARNFLPIRAWDGTQFGACFPNGTKSVLFFGYNGDGYKTYGAPGGLNGGGGAGPSAVKVYNPGVSLGQNAPTSYPFYLKVWAYSIDELAQVQNGTLAFNQVKPYAVWNMPIPYQTGSLTQGDLELPARSSKIAYDQSSKRIYFSRYGVVHVYEISNAVI